MILIDVKGDKLENHPGADIIAHIRRLGVSCERGDLQFADAAFEGKGPHGTILVGLERKTIHDMLNCVDDSRFAGHQSIGMRQMYQVAALILEGHWKPHDGCGVLMEGFNGGVSWGFCKYRSQRTMYAKLYRYLISVSLSGVVVSYSRDVFHTAFNIVEWYQYFQKPWMSHTSQLEKQQLNIPTLHRKPSLVNRWAHELENVGVKLAADAERVFRKPITLAMADESEWLHVPGVGVKTAQQIYREINGLSKPQ